MSRRARHHQVGVEHAPLPWSAQQAPAALGVASIGAQLNLAAAGIEETLSGGASAGGHEGEEGHGEEDGDAHGPHGGHVPAGSKLRAWTGPWPAHCTAPLPEADGVRTLRAVALYSVASTDLDPFQLAAVILGARAANVPVHLSPEARAELCRVQGAELPPVRTSTPARATVAMLPDA